MVVSFETEFGRYRIEDVVYNGRAARVLYSEDHMSAHSGVPADGKPEMLFDYNERFLELIGGALPRNVLILGGGAFSLPAVLMKEFPEMRIDVVELDGGLLDAAQKYFKFKLDDRVNVHIADASKFIEETGGMFDAIIVDVFFNDEIPPAFQTLAFARNLRRCLEKGGIVAINVIAAQAGRNSKILRTFSELLQDVFLSVQIFPATRGLSPWMLQNYLVVAHSGSHDVPYYLTRLPIYLNA